jgi:hypothetical protein
LAAAALAPSAAAAPSTASSESGPIDLSGTLTVRAPLGDMSPHRMTVSVEGFSLMVSDSAGVIPGTGCVAEGPTIARCVNAQAVDVYGGNGDDAIVLKTTVIEAFNSAFGFGGRDVLVGSSAANDELTGGAGPDRLLGLYGADRLRGGPGPDFLNGGRSADDLKGGPGIDSIIARDGTEDTFISCQGGADRKERAKVDDEDPPALSC